MTSHESGALHAELFLHEHTQPVKVHRVRGTERLSRPFFLEVELETSYLDADALRGTNVQLYLRDQSDAERHFTGVVQSVTVHGLIERITDEDEPILASVTIAPKPYLLSYRHGFRIFQRKDVKEIVRQIFDDAGLDTALLDESRLAGTYAKREMCVQYDESEWDFVCRLLEDEGIWFTFRQDIDAAVLELGDDNSKARMAEPATLVHHDPHDRLAGPCITSWCERRQAAASIATLRDHDPLWPSAKLHEQRADDDDPFGREHYEFPGAWVRFSGEEKIDPDHLATRAQVRLEALRATRRVGTGTTTAIALQPGQRFDLVGREFASGEKLVVEMYWDLDLRPRSEAGVERKPSFDVRIDTIPAETPFRPARTTPKPRIFGVQTARVTGPAGQEVHTDEHGRVKVQFHWDRQGALDDQTSCWVRTGQTHTTGSVMIPRMGWEVLIQFEEGDPERPVVLGKVYNPIDPPAYALPAQKTVTGIRSESSPGRNGINEVQFDDHAGSERFDIRAQHDLRTVVANNKTHSVTTRADRAIGGNRTASVGADESISVATDHMASVLGNQNTTIAANRDLKVSAGVSSETTGAISSTVGSMEMMMVGNPVGAAVELIAAKVLSKVAGKAAEAVGRANTGVLGAVRRGLEGAQRTMGPLAQFAGPATSLLAGGDPAAATLGHAVGEVLAADNALAALTGAGVSMAGVGIGKITSGGHDAVRGGGPSGGGSGGDERGASRGSGGDAGGDSAGGGSGGASDSGDAGGGDSDSGDSGGGDSGGGSGAGAGQWATVAGGSVTESIGAVGMMATAQGINFGIAGSSTEAIGGARIEAIKKGKAENIGLVKTETVVGLYSLSTTGGFTIDAKAAVAINVGSRLKMSIAGGHSMASKGPTKINTTTTSLEASTITLKCGQAEVAIGSGGVEIKGLQVTFKASEITVDPAAIKPG